MTEINSAGFQREAPPLIPDQCARAGGGRRHRDGGHVRLHRRLVVYTALAENWAGGPAGIVNWINLGISETNSAYATSGVHQRVRLAHAERVAYTEVGSFSTNLNNLRAGAAGLDTVPALRNVYTADLVSMFVRPVGADACGIAFIMTTVSTAFAPNGYSVVDSPCSSPNGTLAHEFGHNMGLRHDWYMDSGVTPFTYAHGYVNLRRDSGRSWPTPTRARRRASAARGCSRSPIPISPTSASRWACPEERTPRARPVTR